MEKEERSIEWIRNTTIPAILLAFAFLVFLPSFLYGLLEIVATPDRLGDELMIGGLIVTSGSLVAFIIFVYGSAIIPSNIGLSEKAVHLRYPFGGTEVIQRNSVLDVETKGRLFVDVHLVVRDGKRKWIPTTSGALLSALRPLSKRN